MPDAGGPVYRRSERAILHLMYSRFIQMVLSDLGLVSSEIPFKNLLAQEWCCRAQDVQVKGDVVDPMRLSASMEQILPGFLSSSLLHRIRI